MGSYFQLTIGHFGFQCFTRFETFQYSVFIRPCLWSVILRAFESFILDFNFPSSALGLSTNFFIQLAELDQVLAPMQSGLSIIPKQLLVLLWEELNLYPLLLH